MPRSLLFAALLLLSSCGPSVVEAPINGTWKVILLNPGEESTLFLVETIQKSNGPSARLVAAGKKGLEEVKFEAQRDERGALRLTVGSEDVNMVLVAHPPEGEAHPRIMLGYGERSGERQFVRFERTEEKKLDQKKSTVSDPSAADLKRALAKDDFKERASALRPIVDEHANDVLGYFAGLELLGSIAASGSPEANVRTQADKLLAFAAAYGSVMKAQSCNTVARILIVSGKQPGLAVEYARLANEAVGESMPAEEQVPVVRTLVMALRRAGKDDEARETAKHLEKLDEELDRKFLEKEIPFATEKVSRRIGRGDRTVLVELFTGAHCAPCTPADIAFDALNKSRQGGDIVLLQYHVHTAGADALGNPDTDARNEYYRTPGTPWFYLDGAEGPRAGGPPEQAKEVYGELLRSLQEPLSQSAGARLTLTVKRTGDRLEAHCAVSEVKKPGETVRLRLVLVEEVVRYPGRNGQRLHHYVVRAFPGGVAGVAVREPAAAPAWTIDLAEVRKSLGKYLDEKGFSPEGRPLALKKLKIVAFLQDDRTREVLQAAETDVPESP